VLGEDTDDLEDGLKEEGGRLDEDANDLEEYVGSLMEDEAGDSFDIDWCGLEEDDNALGKDGGGLDEDVADLEDEGDGVE